MSSIQYALAYIIRGIKYGILINISRGKLGERLINRLRNVKYNKKIPI